VTSRREALTVGVEEEFHTVGLGTRRLTAQGGRVLEQLPAGSFCEELQQTMVEANSSPHARLDNLAVDLAALRLAAIDAAARCGLGIVAAGTVPIADQDTGRITAKPRYEHMRGEYRMLVSEQLICAMHVHVGVPDRELAVALAHRVTPWLPALLALSASSPFWLGNDSGYASYRTLIWRRWPTTGVPGEFASAADYDQTVADLVRSGVITDPGMIYFDVRPSAHLPTLELRICDSCPSLQDVVLLAGLFRALVSRESDAALVGQPPLSVRPELLEAETWRAARSGLEGDLVDPATATPMPAGQLIRQLLAGLRLALEASGDWEQVTELAEAALARGSSAARQRAVYAVGGPQKVVDLLLKETRADTNQKRVGVLGDQLLPGWRVGARLMPVGANTISGGPRELRPARPLAASAGAHGRLHRGPDRPHAGGAPRVLRRAPRVRPHGPGTRWPPGPRMGGTAEAHAGGRRRGRLAALRPAGLAWRPGRHQPRHGRHP
jgi:carboxylate-amine ligase